MKKILLLALCFTSLFSKNIGLIPIQIMADGTVRYYLAREVITQFKDSEIKVFDVFKDAQEAIGNRCNSEQIMDTLQELAINQFGWGAKSAVGDINSDATIFFDKSRLLRANSGPDSKLLSFDSDHRSIYFYILDSEHDQAKLLQNIRNLNQNSQKDIKITGLQRISRVLSILDFNQEEIFSKSLKKESADIAEYLGEIFLCNYYRLKFIAGRAISQLSLDESQLEFEKLAAVEFKNFSITRMSELDLQKRAMALAATDEYEVNNYIGVIPFRLKPGKEIGLDTGWPQFVFIKASRDGEFIPAVCDRVVSVDVDPMPHIKSAMVKRLGFGGCYKSPVGRTVRWTAPNFDPNRLLRYPGSKLLVNLQNHAVIGSNYSLYFYRLDDDCSVDKLIEVQRDRRFGFSGTRSSFTVGMLMYGFGNTHYEGASMLEDPNMVIFEPIRNILNNNAEFIVDTIRDSVAF